MDTGAYKLVKSTVHCTAGFSASFKSLSGSFFCSTLTQINVGPPFSTDLILAVTVKVSTRWSVLIHFCGNNGRSFLVRNQKTKLLA